MRASASIQSRGMIRTNFEATKTPPPADTQPQRSFPRVSPHQGAVLKLPFSPNASAPAATTAAASSGPYSAPTTTPARAHRSSVTAVTRHGTPRFAAGPPRVPGIRPQDRRTTLGNTLARRVPVPPPPRATIVCAPGANRRTRERGHLASSLAHHVQGSSSSCTHFRPALPAGVRRRGRRRGASPGARCRAR